MSTISKETKQHSIGYSSNTPFVFLYEKVSTHFTTLRGGLLGWGKIILGCRGKNQIKKTRKKQIRVEKNLLKM